MCKNPNWCIFLDLTIEFLGIYSKITLYTCKNLYTIVLAEVLILIVEWYSYKTKKKEFVKWSQKTFA